MVISEKQQKLTEKPAAREPQRVFAGMVNADKEKNAQGYLMDNLPYKAMDNPAMPPKLRVRVLDFLRGFSVISMVAYHALFNLVYFFGAVNAPWYSGTAGYLWQQSTCWVFVLVAGASLHYGRRPLRHGLVVLGCALVLTAITAIMGPPMLVSFGVLHMLGCSLLLFALLRPAFTRVPGWLGVVLCFMLFVFFKMLPYGHVGFFDIPLAAVPAELYTTGFLFPLGLPGPGFFSSDYFPLLPWFFLFLTGWYGWGFLKGHVKAAPPGKNPVEWIGRHSLPIYMVHQPVLYGLFWVLSAMGLL